MVPRNIDLIAAFKRFSCCGVTLSNSWSCPWTSILFLVLNTCANNPCKHGATCLDLASGLRCICPVGYKGKFCAGKKINVR